MAKNKRSKKNNRIYFNRGIRAKQVRCLHGDENVGVIPIGKALKMAEDAGLDLVQISSPKDGPPTCKITDYGKYKYDMSKRDKERAKKQRESAVKQKEVKFRPNTNINDLRTKAKRASKFISEGCRVRVAIQFKGREMSHKFIAEDRFQEFLSLLEVDVNILNEPKMDGRAMVALLAAANKRQAPARVEQAS